jgi:hypothetical protein
VCQTERLLLVAGLAVGDAPDNQGF